jgi:hypothetical protein
MGQPIEGEMSPAQREQRRQATASHGAYSYAARLANGQLITDAMALCESKVLAKCVELGPRGMVQYGCELLSTQVELVKGLLEGAASPADAERLLVTLNKFTVRATDAWAKLAALPGDEPKNITDELSNHAVRQGGNHADRQGGDHAD